MTWQRFQRFRIAKSSHLPQFSPLITFIVQVLSENLPHGLNIGHPVASLMILPGEYLDFDDIKDRDPMNPALGYVWEDRGLKVRQELMSRLMTGERQWMQDSGTVPYLDSSDRLGYFFV